MINSHPRGRPESKSSSRMTIGGLRIEDCSDHDPICRRSGLRAQAVIDSLHTQGDSIMKTYLLHIAIVLGISILLAPASASAQASGSGKPAPDMKGPAPRLPNGKPSFSGLWSTTRRADVTNKNIPGYIAE